MFVGITVSNKKKKNFLFPIMLFNFFCLRSIFVRFCSRTVVYYSISELCSYFHSHESLAK